MKAGQPSLYCSAQAFKLGIPAVDIECGRLGKIEPRFVEKIVMAVESLLKHLNMCNGSPIKAQKILFIEERSQQTSSHTGFFYSLKSSGDYVVKGMRIGYVTDFFGQHLQDVFTDNSGVILYMLGTPPVNKGETLMSLGIIKADN